MPEAAPRYSDANVWFGIWKCVVVQLYSGDVGEAQVERVLALAKELAAAGDYFTFTLILPQPGTRRLPKVDPAARELVRRYEKGATKKSVATAQVIGGDGLWAATVRAILTGMNLLNPSEIKVFADVPSGASWLCSHRALPALELAAFVDAARLQWRPHA
jgi:hypothetical protein